MRLQALALSALALLALPPRASAQGPLSLGAGAGLAMPVGDFGDATNPGFRALGTLAVHVPLVPIGARLDLAYDRFPFQAAPLGAAGSSTGAQTIVSATANVVLHMPGATPIGWYAIGGAGPYRVGCSGVASCESVTRTGWNAGIGAQVGLLAIHGFVEARLHSVSVPGGGSARYVPITVGLLF